jgi:hypothetical protein
MKTSGFYLHIFDDGFANSAEAAPSAIFFDALAKQTEDSPETQPTMVCGAEKREKKPLSVQCRSSHGTLWYRGTC